MTEFLPLIVSIVAAVFLAGPLGNWLVSMFGTNKIANDGTRRFAEAALTAFAWPAIFAASFALFGLAYGFGSFLFVWALLTAFHYFMPPRR